MRWDGYATAREWILANEDRVCVCGHLWLHHKSERKCEHHACTEKPRKERCRHFADTGFRFDVDEMHWDDETNGLKPGPMDYASDPWIASLADFLVPPRPDRA